MRPSDTLHFNRCGRQKAAFWLSRNADCFERLRPDPQGGEVRKEGSKTGVRLDAASNGLWPSKMVAASSSSSPWSPPPPPSPPHLRSLQLQVQDLQPPPDAHASRISPQSGQNFSLCLKVSLSHFQGQSPRWPAGLNWMGTNPIWQSFQIGNQLKYTGPTSKLARRGYFFTGWRGKPENFRWNGHVLETWE